MAEQGRADAPDRFAHGTGSTEKKEAERDDFRPGVTGGTSQTLPDTGRATAEGAGGAHTSGVAGAGPQSIEATTAALGDMEPSAGSGGRGSAGAAESANDDDTST
jgi:hypothetical protein